LSPTQFGHKVGCALIALASSYGNLVNLKDTDQNSIYMIPQLIA